MPEISSSTLITLVVIGTILLVMTVIFVVLLVTVSQKRLVHQQKEMFLALLETQEKERQRIGADLHDSLGPHLSAVKVKSSRLEGRLESAGVEAQTEFKVINEMMDYAVQAVREASHNLMPPAISNGLDAALNQFLDRVSTRQTEVRYISRGFSSTNSQIADTNIFRIVQELVYNALKYANASIVKVFVYYDKEQKLTIVVKDNGTGKPEDIETGTGIGFTNIHNRLNMLGGKLKVSSVPTGGLSFEIKFVKPFWV